MLKIKDNVDLKELEKYGFEYIKNHNYPRMSSSEYVYSYLNCIYVYENTKALILRHNDTSTLDILYDLIKDGLVEKVED